jgi:hypothetical protein
LLRGLIRSGLTQWHGVLAIFVVGLVIIAAWLDVLASNRRVIFLSDARPFLLAAGGWLGAVLAMTRTLLKKPRPEWRDLATFGKVSRLIVVVIGTAIFAAPFAWLAFLILAR